MNIWLIVSVLGIVVAAVSYVTYKAYQSCKSFTSIIDSGYEF